MAKQLKKFCRITKYVQQEYPKLYDVLDGVCMGGAFRPRRGHSGVTFIIPGEKTMAHLNKLLYSEDVDECIDILEAHIVQDYLPSGAVWKAHASDIPTAAGKKLEVAEAAGTAVTLKDGAKLELDTKFKTLKGDHTQVVWKVKSGELDYKKHTKQATFEHARQQPGAPRKAKDVEAGKKRTRGGLAALGGSLMSYAGGSAKHASAPFGYLVALFEFVRGAAEADDTAKRALTELRIILDPNMVTSLAFTLRKDSCLSKYVEDFSSQAAEAHELYGRDAYLEMVRKNHQELGSAKSGGGHAEDLEFALAKAFSAARSGSEDALRSVSVDSSFTPDVFTALNLSRMLEQAVLSKAKVEGLAGLRDMVDVVIGRANGDSAETNPKVQGLGQLVAGLLVHVRDFVKSDFARYPFGPKAKSAYAKSEKTCKSVYQDKSVAGILAKLSPEQLSSLFTNLPSKEEEDKEDKEDKEEAGKDVDEVVKENY